MNPCPTCGGKIYPEDLYCGQCGASLSEPESLNGNGETIEAIALNDIQLSLGVVFYKKGEFRKAVEKFKQVLKFDPGNKRAEKLLAQAVESLQEKKESPE